MNSKRTSNDIKETDKKNKAGERETIFYLPAPMSNGEIIVYNGR